MKAKYRKIMKFLSVIMEVEVDTAWKISGLSKEHQILRISIGVLEK